LKNITIQDVKDDVEGAEEALAALEISYSRPQVVSREHNPRGLVQDRSQKKGEHDLCI